MMCFPKWESLLGHQVYAVFIDTDYFYKRLEFLLPLLVVCERTTLLSTPDTYQLLLFYQTNVFHSYTFFLSLFRKEEVDLPRYKTHVVDARDDSNTLTMARAER